MFIYEAIKAAAARATVQPQHHRICGGIALRFNKVIVQVSVALLVNLAGSSNR
jgi:hypothetical protein